MRAGAVPVALHRLRVERGRDAEVLGDAVQQVARHPELVGDVERAERADLELPLAGHHLGVDARDREAGVEARVEVRLDDVAAVHLVGADAAVVEALRRGEAAAVGEAVRTAVLEERVLLLDAEQRLVARVLLGDRREQRRACSSGAASCRAAAPRTSRACCRRRGSGRDTRTTGCSTQSELLPGAWFVLEPSKPQIGRSAPSVEDLRLRTQPSGRLGAVDPDVLRLVDHVALPAARSIESVSTSMCRWFRCDRHEFPAGDFPAVARL